MKLEYIKVFNFEGAIRGMRNPKNSWHLSDSIFEPEVIIGPNDMKLMQNLIKSGSEHRKFMRQILVSFDMTAPLYIWKEFDTYKVGTVANSTSTMHKMLAKPITRECFEIDDLHDELQMVDPQKLDVRIDEMIDNLEQLRQLTIEYTNEAKEEVDLVKRAELTATSKKYWKELIRWLPESWLQTRTITMNYETLYTICHQRKGHKLSEWKTFIDTIKTMPYANELIFLDNE